jgi:hypothetical protein
METRGRKGKIWKKPKNLGLKSVFIKKDLSCITPRISRETQMFLVNNFKTLNAGAEYCLNSLLKVSEGYIYSLRGRFTKPQINILIDVMQGTLLLTGIQAPLVTCLDEYIKKLNGEYPEEKKTASRLMNELLEMSSPEIFFLEIWVSAKANK